MPDLHRTMVYILALLIVCGGVMMLFAPPQQLQFLQTVVLTLVGALVGKFSNGFGQPLKQLLSQEKRPKS